MNKVANIYKIKKQGNCTKGTVKDHTFVRSDDLIHNCLEECLNPYTPQINCNDNNNMVGIHHTVSPSTEPFNLSFSLSLVNFCSVKPNKQT